jgi:hypothetical protein
MPQEVFNDDSSLGEMRIDTFLKEGETMIRMGRHK